MSSRGKILTTVVVVLAVLAIVLSIVSYLATQSAQPQDDGLAEHLVLHRCGTGGEKYGEPGLYRTTDNNPDHTADAIKQFLQEYPNLHLISHNYAYVGSFYTIYFDYIDRYEGGGGQ